MAIALVAGNTRILAANADATHVFPGTPVENDVVVIGESCDDDFVAGDGIVSGTGFTIHAETVSYNSSGSGSQFVYKRMGPTPDTGVAVVASSTKVMNLVCQVFSGVDTTTASDMAPVQTTAGTGYPNAGSATTVTNAALRILFGTLDDDDDKANVVAPSGFSNLIVEDTGQASTTIGCTSMMASKTEATAGALDPAAFTGSGSDKQMCWHWALRPAAGGTDACLANDITTGAPTLGNPAVGQTHVVLANDVTAGAPTLGSPTVGQVHAVTADDVTAGAPVLSTPAVGQTHVVAAGDITTGAPTLGNPAAGHIHVLAAEDIVTGAPTLGNPAVGQVHVCLADDIVTGAPTLGHPAVGVAGGAVGPPNRGGPPFVRMNRLMNR